MIKVFSYDNTFEGFLTVIFECYRQSVYPGDIQPQSKIQQTLFGGQTFIPSDSIKAERVWNAIRKRMEGPNRDMLFYSFLSETDGIEMKILRFIRRLLSERFNIETDFGDSDVLFLNQTARQVKREAVRMMQFVRFQRTAEGLWFCGIEPRYDVIPMVLNHYKNRFPGQRWIIYDLKRDYGIYNDGNEVSKIVIAQKEFDKLNGVVDDSLLEESEVFYQNLWKTYFKNINIKERKNLRLQRQHLPQRFWKFLPEMQPG
jgi:probable DNA metabolism protein